MRKGFTLVEIIVVLGVFGILVLAGTEFIIQMVKNNNQTIIKNEVRQNAASVMRLLTDSIRNAACVKWSGTSDIVLTTYSDTGCTAGQEKDIYTFNTTTDNGRIYKGSFGNYVNLISDSVAACVGSACATTCSTNGFSVQGTSGSSLPVIISLTLQQTPRASLRSDFCGQIILTETVSPRKY